MATGHVEKQGDRWKAVVELDPDPRTGKRRRRVRQADPNTERAAKRLLAKLLTEIEQGTYVDPSKMMYKEYLEQVWLPAHKGQVQRGTWKGYKSKVSAVIAPGIGNVPVQKITAPMLNQWYVEMNEAGAALAQVKGVHAVVNKSLEDARVWGILARNPARDARPPKKDADRKRQFRYRDYSWTQEELRTFLAHVAQDRLYPMWHLFASTGMRRSEVCGLLLNRLLLDGPRPHLRVEWKRSSMSGEVYEDEPKTKNSRRLIDLDADTVAVLKAWLKRRKRDRDAAGEAWTETGYVFVDELGQPLKPERVTRMGVKAIGECLPRRDPARRPYDLRHTHATLMIEAGVPIHVVSRRLGHASVAFTLDHYADVTDAMFEGAAEVAGHILRAPDESTKAAA